MKTVLKSLLVWLAEIREQGVNPTWRMELAKLWATCFIGIVCGPLVVTAWGVLFSGEALDWNRVAKETLGYAITGTIVPLVVWNRRNREKVRNQSVDLNAVTR